MTDQPDTPEPTEQEADATLYETIYGAPQRPPLSGDDEALYASFYAPKGLSPLTADEQHLYNQFIPEN